MIVIIIHNNHNNPHLKLSYYLLNYSISSPSFFLFFFLFRQSHRVFFPSNPLLGGKKGKEKKRTIFSLGVCGTWDGPKYIFYLFVGGLDFWRWKPTFFSLFLSFSFSFFFFFSYFSFGKSSIYFLFLPQNNFNKNGKSKLLSPKNYY